MSEPGIWELGWGEPQGVIMASMHSSRLHYGRLGWMEAADNLQASHGLLMGAAGLTE